jgi:hypothetical protein
MMGADPILKSTVIVLTKPMHLWIQTSDILVRTQNAMKTKMQTGFENSRSEFENENENSSDELFASFTNGAQCPSRCILLSITKRHPHGTAKIATGGI